MAVLKWRPQALKDLEAIEAYYKEVAPDYAALFVASVFEKAGQLERLPHMGRMVPEIGAACRILERTVKHDARCYRSSSRRPAPSGV